MTTQEAVERQAARECAQQRLINALRAMLSEFDRPEVSEPGQEACMRAYEALRLAGDQS